MIKNRLSLSHTTNKLKLILLSRDQLISAVTDCYTIADINKKTTLLLVDD